MKKLNAKLALGLLSLTFCLAATAAQDAANEQGIKDSGRGLAEPSKKLSRERIDREARQAAQESREQPVKDALMAVQQSAQAMEFLDKNDAKQAKAALEGALGKMDLVLASHPNVALVPVSAEVRIIDLNADDARINHISSTVKDFVKQGQYQAARLLLRDFASEIDLTALNLPLGSYPPAIRRASKKIDQNKLPEAKSDLLTALNSLVLTERVTPLPIIRAQALVDEVSRQAQAGKIDKKEADVLLEDANRQLVLAEKLGYGTRKQDFDNVLTSIKQVQASIDKGQAPKSLLGKIEDSLKTIKDKVSRAPASL
ncbi:MAG: YfdX family protein [Deltaproteobacteria bacterium]|nr:YfdX family protein [Deltaproteobacteria bacterium]